MKKVRAALAQILDSEAPNEVKNLLSAMVDQIEETTASQAIPPQAQPNGEMPLGSSIRINYGADPALERMMTAAERMMDEFLAQKRRPVTNNPNLLRRFNNIEASLGYIGDSDLNRHSLCIVPLEILGPIQELISAFNSTDHRPQLVSALEAELPAFRIAVMKRHEELIPKNPQDPTQPQAVSSESLPQVVINAVENTQDVESFEE